MSFIILIPLSSEFRPENLTQLFLEQAPQLQHWATGIICKRFVYFLLALLSGLLFSSYSVFYIKWPVRITTSILLFLIRFAAFTFAKQSLKMKTKGSKSVRQIKELNKQAGFKIPDFQARRTTSTCIHLQYCGSVNCKKQQQAANTLPVRLPLPLCPRSHSYLYMVTYIWPPYGNYTWSLLAWDKLGLIKWKRIPNALKTARFINCILWNNWHGKVRWEKASQVAKSQGFFHISSKNQNNN